jgi:hypothetical protein
MRIAILHYSKPPVIGGVERVIGEQAAVLRPRSAMRWKCSRATSGMTAKWDAVIVHNVFTMPFDLEWTRELLQLARTRRHPLDQLGPRRALGGKGAAGGACGGFGASAAGVREVDDRSRFT